MLIPNTAAGVGCKTTPEKQNSTAQNRTHRDTPPWMPTVGFLTQLSDGAPPLFVGGLISHPAPVAEKVQMAMGAWAGRDSRIDRLGPSFYRKSMQVCYAVTSLPKTACISPEGSFKNLAPEQLPIKHCPVERIPKWFPLVPATMGSTYFISLYLRGSFPSSTGRPSGQGRLHKPPEVIDALSRRLPGKRHSWGWGRHCQPGPGG